MKFKLFAEWFSHERVVSLSSPHLISQSPHDFRNAGNMVKISVSGMLACVDGIRKSCGVLQPETPSFMHGITRWFKPWVNSGWYKDIDILTKTISVAPPLQKLWDILCRCWNVHHSMWELSQSHLTHKWMVWFQQMFEL